jgi:hypothetical protein
MTRTAEPRHLLVAALLAMAIAAPGCASGTSGTATVSTDLPSQRAGSSPAATSAGAPSSSASAPGTTSPAPTRTAPTSATTAPTAACSASGLAAEPAPQAGLPPPVAEMRASIVSAAVACDFDALEELARQGPGEFSFTFGGATDPSDYWRDAEAAGDEPLRILVQILDLGGGARDFLGQGEIQHYWPAAFGYDSWTDIPPADREALLAVYEESQLEDMALIGSYLGHRVGITAEGDWQFFVAGD